MVALIGPAKTMQPPAPPNHNKKRHHYVSVTYLKGFCDVGGKVVAYRKDAPSEVLHLRPNEIGFENYYYSQPLPDGEQDNHQFEDLFGSVETHWPAALAAARRGVFEPGALHWLYAFMTMMRARVPAAREFHETAMALKMRVEVQALAELGKLPAKLRRYQNELETVDIAVNRQRTLATMTDDMRRFGDMTRGLGFEIILNETDLDFVTSDNPVAYFDPSVPEARRMPYDVDQQIELYFPLDARTLLRGSHQLRLHGHLPRLRRLTDKWRVGAINRVSARFAYRLMFARNRSHDALAEAHAAASPVLNAEIRRNGGDIQIHLRHKFGGRPKLLKFRPERCEEELRDEDLV